MRASINSLQTPPRPHQTPKATYDRPSKRASPSPVVRNIDRMGGAAVYVHQFYFAISTTCKMCADVFAKGCNTQVDESGIKDMWVGVGEVPVNAEPGSGGFKPSSVARLDKDLSEAVFEGSKTDASSRKKTQGGYRYMYKSSMKRVWVLIRRCESTIRGRSEIQ
ncbi:hypothetical protein PM082_011310 [Marasmius tenuissimus]|nr:hypothetical protein PM082_011310 [Marasmius tenuissimus]